MAKYTLNRKYSKKPSVVLKKTVKKIRKQTIVKPQTDLPTPFIKSCWNKISSLFRIN